MERSLHARETPLLQMRATLGRLGGTLGFDRDHIVVNRHVDLIVLDARQFGVDGKAIVLLVDVDG